jgi:hypothetical protein
MCSCHCHKAKDEETMEVFRVPVTSVTLRSIQSARGVNADKRRNEKSY